MNVVKPKDRSAQGREAWHEARWAHSKPIRGAVDIRVISRSRSRDVDCIPATAPSMYENMSISMMHARRARR